MTNAQLNTLINTIDTGGLNTALEVREVLQGIKNEMFPAVHNMNLASDGNNVYYNLNFSKIGNLVYLQGLIANGTNNIVTPSIEINNSLYYGKTGNETIFIKNSLNGGGNISFSINQNFINITNFIPVQGIVFFSDIYKTND
jgi:hypothetical protein